jgi:hypothetical protein
VGWQFTRLQIDFSTRHAHKSSENKHDLTKQTKNEWISRKIVTAFTGTSKTTQNELETALAVLAMTACLTRIHPLASTREAPVVGGQPASGATADQPRTQSR